jgi:hypothetical protein
VSRSAGPAGHRNNLMRVRNFKFLSLGLGLWLLLAGSSGPAQTATPSEYQLKAAFIYNFTKFIDWPPNAFEDDKSPFIIGILGEDPFGKFLDRTVSGKSINTHPITIQVFPNVGAATKCHLLFISRSEKDRLSEIIPKLQGTSVLTVGETEQFIKAGGMINFVEEAKKIRFQINDEAAKAAKLKMSSKLLGLALPSDG